MNRSESVSPEAVEQGYENLLREMIGEDAAGYTNEEIEASVAEMLEELPEEEAQEFLGILGGRMANDAPNDRTCNKIAGICGNTGRGHDGNAQRQQTNGNSLPFEHHVSPKLLSKIL